MPVLRPILLLLGLSLVALPARLPAQDVTIYRCVDAKGNLALRDSPCGKGESQEVRSMQRPKDPPAGTAAIARPSPRPVPAAAPPPVQVVYRTPPRPLYECVTPDGKRYTSDNGEGNPRSVPLWTLGYPARSHHGGGSHIQISGPDHATGGPWPPRPDSGGYYGGGAAYTLVRDECHALPQEEVCSRLSDRRYEIMRRYNSAMQSEIRQLELEQRGIDARINNDCRNQ